MSGDKAQHFTDAPRTPKRILRFDSLIHGDRCRRLPIDLSPVSDPHHSHNLRPVVDLINDPMAANPDAPIPFGTGDLPAPRRSGVFG